MTGDGVVEFDDLNGCALVFEDIFLSRHHWRGIAPFSPEAEYGRFHHCEIFGNGELLESTSFSLWEIGDFGERTDRCWELRLYESVPSPDIPAMAENLIKRGDSLNPFQKTALTAWSHFAGTVLSDVGTISDRVRKAVADTENGDWLSAARIRADIFGELGRKTGMDIFGEILKDRDFLHGFRIRQGRAGSSVSVEYSSRLGKSELLRANDWKGLLSPEEFADSSCLSALFKKEARPLEKPFGQKAEPAMRM